jgi:murein DD-endopeptidase MepM/ murein hydrolase activator NlpD
MFDHAPRPAVHPAVPALVAVLAVMVLGAPSAAAVADAGASAPAPAPVQAASARYQPPVPAPILDSFRAPTTRYGPGNRGIEYGTAVGDRVGAIGAGTVAFAGPVAGRLVVSVVHPDGLRSSLTGLAAISVRVGQAVVAGEQVGASAQRLHLGVRRGETYLDPASLFISTGPARLVPRRR